MNDTTNICITCLSTDRHLVPLHKLALLLQEIKFLELKMTAGGVCWECRSIMLKCLKLRKRAQIAQDILTRTAQLYELHSLTSLALNTKNCHDYEFTYNLDPLTNITKQEPDLIKEEYNELSEEENNITDTDEKFNEPTEKIENVYVETFKTKTGRKIIKKPDKSKLDEQEIKEKFVEVVLSEEEMMKCREDKRNHPNFKKIPYKCDSCVLGFTRKDTYKIHMEKKHDKCIGDYICDVCKVRFQTLCSVEKHRRKHYTCFRCKLCKYEAHEPWTALNHGRTKHTADRPDKIHCNKCEAVLKTPKDLENHIQTEHTLFCNECGVKFKGMNTLKRHKARIHTIKREFICDVCTKTFISKTRLESHMVSHNASIAKKLAYCHPCKIQYKNIYVYRNHLKYSANHSERAYPCPECNKRFASKVYWNKHYNFYHLQKSQYNCEICKKLFISDWRLKNHRQKHHGLNRTRDHACNVCGKKFFTISTLRAHQLTHSEERSYMCEDCGDTFKQRPALYTHARLVHRGSSRK